MEISELRSRNKPLREKPFARKLNVLLAVATQNTTQSPVRSQALQHVKTAKSESGCFGTRLAPTSPETHGLPHAPQPSPAIFCPTRYLPGSMFFMTDFAHCHLPRTLKALSNEGRSFGRKPHEQRDPSCASNYFQPRDWCIHRRTCSHEFVRQRLSLNPGGATGMFA
jgi:hypothetical protein